MSYELSYSNRGFVVIFKGNVTIEEINDANGDIHGHANFDNHNYQIVDFLDADLSSVEMEDAEIAAQTDCIASRTRWNVKVSFVVREAYALKIVNSYVNYAQQLIPTWKFGVFSTQEEALKWVKS